MNIKKSNNEKKLLVLKIEIKLINNQLFDLGFTTEMVYAFWYEVFEYNKLKYNL